MSTNSDPRPPIPLSLAIFVGILAISTASIFIRYAQNYAPSLVVAALRITFATLVLTPVALTRHRGELAALTRRQIGLAILSGLVLALHFATWITSLEYTTVVSSVVIVSTAPLWVALIAPLTIKETLSRPILIGMCLALVGGAVVGLSDSCTLYNGSILCPSLTEFIEGDAFLGDLLALVGAIAAAAYILIGRRLRSNNMSLIVYVFIVYGIAAIILLVIMFMAGESPWGYPLMAYIWFLLLALVPQLLGHSTFNWILRYLPAALVSITLLGEPIGSTFLAYFLLNETPTALKLFGAILILVGITIASLKDQKEK